MSRAANRAVLLASTLGFGMPSAKGSDSKISVATYNVRRCIGTDGRCDVDRVGHVIAEIDADIVALQELSFRESPRGIDQLRRLAEIGGYEYEACRVLENGEGAIGLGLLTRSPVRSARRVDLSFEDYEPRAALSAQIGVSRMRVRVVATHLGLRRRERRHQAALLADELRRREEDDIRILMGDLNDWIPGAPNLTAIKGTVDACRGGVATFPSRLPIFSLDHVWASPGTTVVRREAVRSRLARQASDHLPLVATLDLAALPRA